MTTRILVIGAGFAGMWSALAAARLLDSAGRTDVEIALVAPVPELHVRPRLYEHDPDAMRVPLLEMFQATGVRYIQGMVDAIDVDQQEVRIVGLGNDPGRYRLGYERLVLAAGSRLFRPPIPGLIDHTFSVDQVDDAVRLGAHLQGLARRPASARRNTVVVAGAGFTGIETAAEIPARLREILGADADVKVVMVERNNAVGPDLGEGPRPIITQALRELGVTWKLGSGVAAVDAGGVRLENGERIEADTVIWSAGTRASTLTAQIPGERDAYGRLHVDRSLAVKGVRNVFASGDCAYATTDDEGNHATMSCQHAMNLGRASGHNAAADIIGQERLPYSQPNYVTCVDLGPWGAVYTEGWEREVKLSGALGKDKKRVINTDWIYPPKTLDRSEIFAQSDPARIVVA